MRRKLAVLSLAALVSGLLLAPAAEAGCKHKQKGRKGKYVTYNGASFGSCPQAYAPQPTYQPEYQPAYGPSSQGYAPSGQGAYMAPPPPPM